jgi:hypothetical protein
MIKLRSFSQTFARYAELDVDNATLVVKTAELSPEEAYAMAGTFDLLNNEVLAFFKQSGSRFLFFKDKIIHVEDTDFFICKRLDQETCRLNLTSESGKTKLDVIYNQRYYGEIDRIGWAEDEEDRNFGLWIAKQLSKSNEAERS